MKIMVSACLLGENCKYNGKNNLNENVLSYIKGHDVIPVCPEVLGGLPVPRLPAEIAGETVITSDGSSVDKQFRLGAKKALELAVSEKIDIAILQPRSPSCGVNEIYDGSFSGNKILESGVFSTLLIKNGFKAIDASDL